MKQADSPEVNGGGAPDVSSVDPVPANPRKSWLIGVAVVVVLAILVLIAA